MTDPDPRIRAAAKVISPALHGWHDGFDEGDCPDCQAVTAEALAAADAVDPLRDDLTLKDVIADALAEQYSAAEWLGRIHKLDARRMILIAEMRAERDQLASELEHQTRKAWRLARRVARLELAAARASRTPDD